MRGDLWHRALARAGSGAVQPSRSSTCRLGATRCLGARGRKGGGEGSRGEPGSWHRTGNLSVISARLSTQISSCATPGTWIYMKVSLLITIPVGGLVHPVSQKNKGVDSQTQVDESRKAELVTPRLFLALPLPRPARRSCVVSCPTRPQPSAVQTPHCSHTGVWHRAPRRTCRHPLLGQQASTRCSASTHRAGPAPLCDGASQRVLCSPWESRPLTRQHISGQWWVPFPTAFGAAQAAAWEALGTRHPHVLLQSQNFHF